MVRERNRRSGYSLYPDRDMTESCDKQRRRLLQVAAAVPVLWFAGRSFAAGADPGIALPAERKLSLINTHTGESLSAAYCKNGRYCPDTLSRMNLLLRDHRSGESHVMDPGLFDLLHDLAARAGEEPKFEVISGYRSAATNAELHEHTSGVASGSLHMQGKAMDVRLAGISCAKLRDLALDKGRGGVGYYRKSDFVHLDTGRVRFWKG